MQANSAQHQKLHTTMFGNALQGMQQLSDRRVLIQSLIDDRGSDVP